MTLRLNLLGGFRLLREGETVVRPHAKKAKALLAFLAFQGGRPVTRDQLAALLWSRSDHERARHSLSQALSSIHEAFEWSAKDTLLLSRDSVTLSPDALEVDAILFSELCSSREPNDMRRAAALFTGDFLDGLYINEPAFQGWQRAEQARLREMAVTALSGLMEAGMAGAIPDDPVITGLRLLSIDELNEPAHRALMQIYARQGRNDAALRQYDALKDVLKRELDAEPEAESRSVVRAIRDSRGEAKSDRWNDRFDAMFEANDRPSIVVLPFTDYSDDRDPHRFADGLTDDLIGDLSRIGGLLVIARATSFAYKNRSLDVRLIARRLGVRYVVEGSVRRDGNRVRVNIQFVDGRSGARLWSDRFDRDIESLFLVQNEITSRIAAALRLEILQSECRRIRLSPPENPTAWSYAMQGWAELWTRTMSRDSFVAATRMIHRALELDPEQGLAWTAKARLNYVSALYPVEWSDAGKPADAPGNRVEFYGRALDAARKAVDIDPTSAEAHAELASALKANRKYEQAVLASETALRLNPNYEEAYTNLATLKKDMGAPAEGVELLDRSLLIAPHLPTDGRRHYFKAWAYLVAEQHDEALSYANRGMVLDGDASGPHWVRACVFGWRGEKDAAAEALARLEAVDPELSNLKQFAIQYRHVFNNEHALEGLARAGMRER